MGNHGKAKEMKLYESVCQWLGHIRLSRVIILMCLVLFFVPLVTHYYLSQFDSKSENDSSAQIRNVLDSVKDFSTLTALDLKLRIEEMLRIKASVSRELRELESRRQRLQQELVQHTNLLDDLKQQHLTQQTELFSLKISLEQAQIAREEAIRSNTPELAPPQPIISDTLPNELAALAHSDERHCRMYSCFDHSHCSLTSGFPVYLYDPDIYSVLHKGYEVDGYLKTTIKQTMGYNAHFTAKPEEACVFVLLVGEAFSSSHSQSQTSFESPLDETALKNLPYWGGDGRNHILINFSRRELSVGAGNVFASKSTGKSMLVQSIYTQSQFRSLFDIIAPPMLGPPGGDVWHDCAPIVPARRKYLLSFQGELNTKNLNQMDSFIVEHLTKMPQSSTNDLFLFEFECQPATEQNTLLPILDWCMCGTDNSRKSILSESTFALIIAPGDKNYRSTPLILARLYEALRTGAIPIFLGGDQLELPYSEVLDWNRAAIFMSKSRITELHFFLRSISDSDLLAFRQQGRNYWEKYLSTVQANIDTIIALVRTRLNIPAKPISSTHAIPAFNNTFIPANSVIIPPETEPEESLGPVEAPYASPAFKRNYTYMLIQGYQIWNDRGDPFNLYPQLPFDPSLSTDAKFFGSPQGFRPIGKGAGGSGREFCEALGGNHPREQFSVIILTYEREQVVLSSIARLRGLPYLNKVIVVWNSPTPPGSSLVWPDIGVPVMVVKPPRNSLNNRFLPFDIIDTEAVLSVDDDAHLRHDEIIFAFRVWRENRDRVVGFPGRYHAWDLNFNNGFLYNSNYSCELSMVLTGAAFVHKYYLWMYSNWLPQAIRDKVDELMNCEDIAMNYLVSHLSKKPPVKVTSRWTFRCPGCPATLSSDETHFHERHKCIQFFTKVFGYTPLLYTQFRADSILFKTRISHDKQKCFKFI